MILVDANLLLHAGNTAAVEHAAARAWIDERLSGAERVGLPWASLLAYLRIATHPRILPNPVAVADAWHQVRHWLTPPASWVPAPTQRHADVLESVLRDGRGGNDVPDAHLAALAIEHGLTLCTTDRGFARYSGLRWENPLTTS